MTPSQSPTSAVRNAIVRKQIALWTRDDVREWLIDVGCEQYAHLIADEHCVSCTFAEWNGLQVDGEALLLLEEADLRQPPLSISRLGDVKRLGAALRRLRSSDELPKSPRSSISIEPPGCAKWSVNFVSMNFSAATNLNALTTTRSTWITRRWLTRASTRRGRRC